jgi:hypothetical protein
MEGGYLRAATDYKINIFSPTDHLPDPGLNHESKYLLVFNVPKLNLEEEFRIFVKRFGSVESHQVTDIQGEEFSEVHMLKMASLKMAQVHSWPKSVKMEQNLGRCFSASTIHCVL